MLFRAKTEPCKMIGETQGKMTHCTNPLHPAERMYKPDAGQQYAHQLQHVWTTIVRTKKKR